MYVTAKHNTQQKKYVHLAPFVLFIKSNCLQEYATEYVRLAQERELPLLKFFTDYTTEQLIEQAIAKAPEFLDIFIENKTDEFIKKAQEQWASDQLPYMIKKEQIEAADITIVSYIRKLAMLKFVPVYTSDVNICYEITAELEDFFTTFNSVLTDTYINILKQRIDEDARVQASEERLRLAIESTQLGTWDFNILTKELVISDKCMEILGAKSKDELTYDNFINSVVPEDRDHVHEANISVLQRPENPYLELEYRIINMSDKKLRWIKSNARVLFDKGGQPYRSTGTLLDITHKKLAEEELAQSELRYSSLIKASTSVIWTTDANGAYVTPQHSWEEYTGQPFEQHKDFGWVEKIHPEDRERIATQWQENLKHKRVHHCWGRMWSAKHNDWRYFTARAVPIMDDEGNVTEWIGMDTDIHDQKLAEQALQKSEREFRHLADAMPQMVWTTNAQGRADYFNKKWIDYTGLEVTGPEYAWDIIIHPDDVQRSVKAWGEAIKTGRLYEVEYRIKNKDTGQYRWFLCRGLPLLNKENQIIKWFGTCTDIHDQKLNNESLKLQAIVLDNMEEGVSISDDKGYILYTNDAEDRIFGYDTGELIGKHVSIQNVYDEEENIARVNSTIEHLKTNGSWSGEWHNVRKDGTPFYTFSHISSLEIDGKTYFICVQRDVTEEKQAKEELIKSETRYKVLAEELEARVEERTQELLEANAQLARSNNELEQFAYVASHDLQEPLRKVKAFGDILNAKYREQLSDEGADIIKRMQSTSHRMSTLIDDLLTYSRATKDAETEDVNINLIIQEVISDLFTLIQEKKGKINTGDIQPIKGNALQIRQLFQNLIGNALKFSKRDTPPQIDITATVVKGGDTEFAIREEDKDKQFQLIEVSDNGIGFEQQYADKIFQMFQRLHGKVEYSGSGIGLAIVQRVVNNHNGYVIAEGRPGEGATFQMLFPL